MSRRTALIVLAAWLTAGPSIPPGTAPAAPPKASLLSFPASAARPAAPSQAQRISPSDAARIKYTKQRFIYLDIGEEGPLASSGGRPRKIKLVSVRETRDDVIGLCRRADIRVEIDGRPLDLVCSPYALPFEADGLRIQADTTSAWLDIGKRVQLSVWEASDPVVDTRLFGFPLRRYRLFSQGTQGYNEPVHLGDGDGDPKGQRFYHNYGFDMAGFEGRDEVLSPVTGTVIAVKPEDGWFAVEDDRGIVLDCGHMASIQPEIKAGSPVRRGQPIGLVGRRGPSGNFSHLHLGLYLSRADFEADRPCRNLNLYPWVLAAYREASGARLLAVARPHGTARTGEIVSFDAGGSVAFDGKIVSYRWELPDGLASDGPVATTRFGRPGLYAVVLRVQDELGRRDADVCRVRIYSAERPENVLPTLFFTASPTLGLRAGDSVHLRGWPQGGEAGPIRLDFGDGAVLRDYRPYADVEHRYAKPGTYLVTAVAGTAGRPITERLKIVVE